MGSSLKVQRVEISNFRSFDFLDLAVGGSSLFLIGENAGGKTSLLTGIARALGRDLHFGRPDFRDPKLAVEITVTLDELSKEQRKLLGDHAEFPPGNPPTLRVQARAIWNEDQEEADVEHVFPKSQRKSRRDERDCIAPVWLPAERDAARVLQFGVGRNLMGQLVETLPIGPSLDQAIVDIQDASTRFGSDGALQTFLAEARDRLRELVPDVGGDVYSMGLAASTGRDLLRQFELVVEHLGNPVAISQQSSGLAQLSVFVFALALAATEPGNVLLVDEPEISLHPQAQRALVQKLRGLDAQVLVATHSSNLLERVDARQVIRLRREAGNVKTATPSQLTDGEASRLRRFTNPYAAEAFFARSVILVEGDSDRVALEALAQRIGRNLDAESVSIVPMNGASKAATYFELFGPRGFQLKLAGIYDIAEMKYFAAGAERAGLAHQPSKTDLEALGFFMCDRDLEDEFVRVLGANAVETVIDTNGDSADFAKFQGQPAHSAKSLDDQIRGFIQSGRTSRKIEYAPLLVDALLQANIPPALSKVLAYV
jgi:predicted ATPase